jgi:hypothetical protein
MDEDIGTALSYISDPISEIHYATTKGSIWRYEHLICPI